MKTIISHSELADWRQCKHKHHLAWRRRLRPAETAPALTLGTIWHELLEAHYRDRDTPTSIIDPGPLGEIIEGHRTFVDNVETETSEERTTLLLWMLNGYLARWGTDDDWEILEVESRFEVPLPNPAGRPSNRYFLKGKIDLVVRDAKGRIWVVDHKTFGSRSAKADGLRFEIQPALYLWAWNQAHPDDPAFGAVLNRTKTARLKRAQTPEECNERHRWTYPASHLDTIAHDAWKAAREIAAGHDTTRSPDTERCLYRCPFTEPCLDGLAIGPAGEAASLTARDFTVDLERH